MWMGSITTWSAPPTRAAALSTPPATPTAPPLASPPADTSLSAEAPDPIMAAAPPAVLASWKDGLARIGRVLDAERILQVTPNADGLSLRPNAESIFMPQPTPAARGTVVLLHGYTAAPWQFKEMAQRFFDAGYNVYVPRMPGHGLQDATGMPTGVDLPSSGQEDRWESFVATTFEDSRALGVPVHAVGLSGGANVGLRMAERYPEMKSLVAMAPYLGGNLPKGIVFPAFNLLDTITAGLFGRYLDHKPWKHNVKVANDPHPHTQGSLGAAMAMQHVGNDVRRIDVPSQYITTDGDMLSGSGKVGRLIRRCKGGAPEAWFRFRADEGVPHAMASPVENPKGAQKIQDMVFDFIDHGKAATS